LIKGAEAENLGFLGNGNVKKYYATLKNVQEKYSAPNTSLFHTTIGIMQTR